MRYKNQMVVQKNLKELQKQKKIKSVQNCCIQYIFDNKFHKSFHLITIMPLNEVQQCIKLQESNVFHDEPNSDYL